MVPADAKQHRKAVQAAGEARGVGRRRASMWRRRPARPAPASGPRGRRPGAGCMHSLSAIFPRLRTPPVDRRRDTASARARNCAVDGRARGLDAPATPRLPRLRVNGRRASARRELAARAGGRGLTLTARERSRASRPSRVSAGSLGPCRQTCPDLSRQGPKAGSLGPCRRACPDPACPVKEANGAGKPQPGDRAAGARAIPRCPLGA